MRARLYELITRYNELTDEEHSELISIIILNREELYQFHETDICYIDTSTTIYINKENGKNEENK